VTTLSDLVNDVMFTVEGYGLDMPRTAYLSAAVTATALTFTVDDGANLAEGIAEIGDELVYIKSVDQATNTVTVAPDGRGYRGTTAAAHAINARVTMSPVMPRALVKRKINETLIGLWPTLWGEASTTLTSNVLNTGYELPVDVEEVLSVDHEESDILKHWGPVRRWRFESNADTVDFPSGKALFIYQDTSNTGNIRVRYRKQPTELSVDTDALTTTGLRSSARAVVQAGAVWRLISSMDLGRLKVSSASMDMVDEGNPLGSATQLAGYLRKVYERELLDELNRLQVSTPPTIHYQG
jgi:hypothetical protein